MSIHIGFNILKADGKSRFQVFQFSEGKIIANHTVKDKVCDCMEFRIESKCTHSTMEADVCSVRIEEDEKTNIYRSINDRLLMLNVRGIIEFYTDCSEDAVEAEGDLTLSQEIIKDRLKRLMDECTHSFVTNERLAASKEEEVSEEVEDTGIEPTFDYSKYPRPNVAEFYVPEKVWEACVLCALTGQNFLIVGHSGSGKSELVYELAKALDLHMEAFNMGAMSEPRVSLIGATHFEKEKGTWFNESRFIKATRAETGIILLDEITRSVKDAFNILLPLLDRQGYIALDESPDSEVVKKGKKICYCATANIGIAYTGTGRMDKALKERFSVIINMEFPPAEIESQILSKRTGIGKTKSEKLVKFATDQRHLAEAEGMFLELVSTRQLIAAAYLIVEGFSYANSIEFAIINHFSGEGDEQSERAKLRQILQKAG